MPLTRVAVLITCFQGGAGLLVLTGALALDPAEYETTVVEGRPAGPGGLAGRARQAGLGVIRVPETGPQLLSRLVQVLRDGRYDVVHTHGHPYNMAAGVLGRLAAVRAGVPRIVHTWHGPPDQRHPWLPPRSARIGLERLAARRTDAFLAVGSQTASRALALGLAGSDRISVCRPAVDPAGFGTGTTWAQARRRLDLPLGVRVVGGVGRLSREKGPDVFLRALARMPGDVMGLWAGEGPQRDRLVRLTGHLGLTDRVRWLGHRDDLAEVLPAFDVLAVPSRAAGLPAAMLEAVGAGIPLVATAVGAHRDVVVARETGLLVAPDRPGALASALGWLLEHPDEGRLMAVRARTVIGADDRYSARALGEALADAYRGGSRNGAQS
jgi:glycosyltransferase involved in cell wall biosynthesis